MQELNYDFGLLKGKKGLITGLANNRSISWHIAKHAKRNGAEIAIAYQNDVLKKRVEPLADEINADMLCKCDVTEEDSISSMFEEIKQKWGKLDFLVHSIAFSDREELKGRFVDTSLKNFLNSMHISCYSLCSLSRAASSLMNEGGSIITLTYYGAEKVIPNYNVMGVAKAALEASVKYIASDLGPDNIRVNAISAGPIKTLASSGIGDFNSMLDMHAKTAPLRRNVSGEDVARSALYLLSDLSSGVTGEVHYVDAGFNKMGAPINNL